ncbi:MAG: hypothetical protein ACSW75_04555 [Lachnospiraceae bacterium]
MGFKRAVRRLPVLLISLSLFFNTCSIKENRAACPCALTLELTGLPVSPVVLGVTGGEAGTGSDYEPGSGTGMGSVLGSGSGLGSGAGSRFSFAEVIHTDTVIVLPVPKGELTVTAVGGALAEGDGSVRIPEGEDAPPLYLFHAAVSTEADQVILPVLLHKQYCKLELVFSGPPGYGPPFEVSVEGFFAGWSADGRPLPGPFSRRLLVGSGGAGGRSVLRLPRQGDDSLLMHIVFSDRIVRTFALGSYIAASGYDWAALDLEDLTLNVDISLTSVTVSTDLWSRTEEMEVWI